MIDIKCIGLERNKNQIMMYSFHYGSGGWKKGIRYTLDNKQGKMVNMATSSLMHGMSIANTSKSTGLSLRRCKAILKQLQR